jgi:hypothetical protein
MKSIIWLCVLSLGFSSLVVQAADLTKILVAQPQFTAPKTQICFLREFRQFGTCTWWRNTETQVTYMMLYSHEIPYLLRVYRADGTESTVIFSQKQL